MVRWPTRQVNVDVVNRFVDKIYIFYLKNGATSYQHSVFKDYIDMSICAD